MIRADFGISSVSGFDLKVFFCPVALSVLECTALSGEANERGNLPRDCFGDTGIMKNHLVRLLPSPSKLKAGSCRHASTTYRFDSYDLIRLKACGFQAHGPLGAWGSIPPSLRSLSSEEEETFSNCRARVWCHPTYGLPRIGLKILLNPKP